MGNLNYRVGLDDLKKWRRLCRQTLCLNQGALPEEGFIYITLPIDASYCFDLGEQWPFSIVKFFNLLLKIAPSD
jgi:hypothetical protein